MSDFFKGFHHLAMKAQDMDAIRRFYVDGLGLSVAKSWKTKNGAAMMIDLGNSNYLEIFEGTADSSGQNVLVHFALGCDDCDKATEMARAAGADITEEPHDFTVPTDPPFTVRIAFCKGPDGEDVEFYQE
jgi:glyoxylase I family protein